MEFQGTYASGNLWMIETIQASDSRDASKSSKLTPKFKTIENFREDQSYLTGSIERRNN